jgi:hypothetical protein
MFWARACSTAFRSSRAIRCTISRAKSRTAISMKTFRSGESAFQRVMFTATSAAGIEWKPGWSGNRAILW